jgi:Protein of unknown function (DUF4019)
MKHSLLHFTSTVPRRQGYGGQVVAGHKPRANKIVRQVALWALPAAAFVFVQGCASNVPSQQASAYSTATGFLTLCDDADFEHALGHFAKPIKVNTTTDIWVKEMQDHRGSYGIPVMRALVSRDTQKLPGTASEPAKMNFVFRTSFLQTTPADEYVSVEKLDGKWQVDEYKFRPSGKPGKFKKANIKKDWEEQNDDDDSQY